ncbi:MAG: hypothetical protein II820_03365 [Ruminiclostridium sp.]|nr:hypothetical protein [Ruminiclostridium sp.]
MKYSGKRALLITAVIFICISVFCSFFFIAELSDHNCTHDDGCEVCRVIAACINIVRGMTANTAALSVSTAAILLYLCVLLSARAFVNNDTLISLKVELLN